MKDPVEESSPEDPADETADEGEFPVEELSSVPLRKHFNVFAGK